MPNPRVSKPVRIAGAGPAGLATAILLAKKGFAVEVHEAEREVAARWKRGLQILENFTGTENILEVLTKSGIGINFYAHPVVSALLFDAKGGSASLNSREPLGYYVKRGAFPGALDRGLLDQALGLGVKVFFNSRKSRKDDVQVFATGPIRLDGMGKEITFTTDLQDGLWVILDPKLAQGGFAYLFVSDAQATLGIAVLHDFHNVDAHFNAARERFQKILPFRIQGEEVSYSRANFFTARSRGREGRCFVGESAGFQDYLFGFGIRYALESAICCARSFAEGVPYDRLWKEALGPRQAVALCNRFLYEIFRDSLAPFFVRKAAGTADFRKFIRMWYKGSFWKEGIAWLACRSWQGRQLDLKTPESYVDTDLKNR